MRYRLIDILNKIANGELKEGTKVIWGEEIYTYHGDDELYRTKGTSDFDLWDEMYLGSLNDEVELIEPEHLREDTKMIEPTECEHEWEEQVIRNGIGEIIKRFRKCVKCQEYVIIENTLKPTDNTTEKIEELKQLDMDFAEIDFSSHEEYARCAIQVLAREMIKQIDKLNEVIRIINKER